MTEQVAGLRETGREKEGEWALEPFVQISEKKEDASQSKAEGLAELGAGGLS